MDEDAGSGALDIPDLPMVLIQGGNESLSGTVAATERKNTVWCRIPVYSFDGYLS